MRWVKCVWCGETSSESAYDFLCKQKEVPPGDCASCLKQDGIEYHDNYIALIVAERMTVNDAPA